MIHPRFYSFILLLSILLTAVCRPAPQAPAPSPAATPTTQPPATPSATQPPTRTPKSSPTPVPPAPEATLLEPSDTLHPPQEPITVSFNQPMDVGSTGSPLSILPHVAGSYRWTNGRSTLTFTPDPHFHSEKTYHISISKTLMAESGQTFSEAPKWKFETQQTPVVNGRFPNQTVQAARRPATELRFNMPMDADSVAAALHVQPQLSYQLAWEAQTLTITPDQSLDFDTLYEFVLDETAVSQNSIPLLEAYSWTTKLKDMRLDITKPAVNGIYGFQIDFNYAVDQESLAEAMQIEPSLPGQWTWNPATSHPIAQFTPTEPPTPGQIYTVTFTKPLLDQYGARLTELEPFDFTAPPPILTTAPQNDASAIHTPVRVTFDRPMDAATTEAAFKIDPAVEGQISWEENTLIFTPDSGYYEGEQQYWITIDDGAEAASGESPLTKPFHFSFVTDAAKDIAFFGYGPNIQVVNVNGRRAVHFVQNNRASHPIALDLYSLSQDTFLEQYRASANQSDWGSKMPPLSTETSRLAKSWTMNTAEANSRHNNVQELIIPPDVAPGFYILNLRTGWVNDQMLVLLTENELVVKSTEGKLLAWLTGGDGNPRPGAEVYVYAQDGSLITSGTTNADGVFKADQMDDAPIMIVAQHGQDVTLSGLDGSWSSYSGGYWPGIEHAPNQKVESTIFVYTERPIYQPGQTVYFKAIVRQDDDAVLNNPPEGTAVTVRIQDSRNNTVRTIELTTNSFGSVNGTFQLAEGAMLGEYHVNVSVGDDNKSQRFKVEDYRKPHFEVNVTPHATRLIDGSNIEITVDSQYFFGEPVANAEVTLRRMYRGVGSWHYEYESLGLSGRTDSNGRLTLTIPTNAHPDSNFESWGNNLRVQTIGIEATVDDGSHLTATGVATVRLFSAATRLHINRGNYFKTPGEPFTIQGNVGDVLTDLPIAGQALTLSIGRYRGSNSFASAQEAQVVTDGNGRFSTQLTVDEPGYYRLRLEGKDNLGNSLSYQSYIYVFDGNRGWSNTSEGELSIETDKESYAPGETAQLMIQSSFDGAALLTVERGTIRREQTITLSAPLTLINLPIEANDTPNIFVSITVWEDQDTTISENMYRSIPDRNLRMAAVKLSVPATDKTLQVTIQPDKEVYAPREEATFTVKVVNGRGEPVSAELSLAMVDEAIYALSKELSLPIFDAFYFERRRLTRTANTFAPRRYLFGGGGGGGGGGGEDLAANPRSEFPDTAAWFPVLHTDFKGEATITITLPDSLTSWRLTAKAFTADTQVGETTRNILTQQEIVVRPILPRAVTSGDNFTLSAVVHNFSTTSQTLDVTLQESDGDKLALDAAYAQQTITLPAGGSQVVGWPIEALTAGEAQLLVQVAQAGAVRDAVQLPLGIRPLAIPDFSTQTGQFQGEFTTSINRPANAAETSELKIELSRSIAGSLLEGLDYLTGFPYGCVEQTMSRALPNAVVGRAFYQLGVSNPELQASLPAQIDASIQQLLGYQHQDGGWGWWYDDASHDYQTAWVIFGLATITDAGYEVDPAVLERGVAWLNENLGSMDKRTRAYALYSMAVAGMPNAEATLALFENVEHLDTFSRSGLALTLLEIGEGKKARELLDLLAETATVGENGLVYWQGDGADGHYRRKTMASDTRSTALALSAFSQIAPNHALVPGMVQWLMAQRSHHGWGTTNETSYAILGLTDHLLATSFREGASNTSYTVLLNEQVVAQGELGRENPSLSLTIPGDMLNVGENGLRIVQGGNGRLYYAIHDRLYLAESEIEAAGSVQVVREYLDAETGRPLTQVTAGQLVQVRLTIRLTADASYMLVEDNLPGGLEALNERLNNTGYTAIPEWEQPRYFWQDYGYNNKEIRGNQVSFFITEMRSGTHTYSYMARATHSGSFVSLPAEAYAMYDQEIWGRSASTALLIE